jgi:hypothetical protein
VVYLEIVREVSHNPAFLANTSKGPRSGVLTKLPDPTKLGLPPPNNSASLPHCYPYDEYKPCAEAGKSRVCLISPLQLISADLITAVKNLKPLFAPNAKSTYSNIAFELLGLVLTKVTSMPYEEYIASSILGPIGMSATTFITPADSVAVLPKVSSSSRLNRLAVLLKSFRS